MCEVGTIADADPFRIPVTRVNIAGHRDTLDQSAKAFMAERWGDELGTEFSTYDQLVQAIKAEVWARQSKLQ